MDERDLRTVFEHLSTRGGPPHALAPDVVVAAARRVRRRRTVVTAGLAGTAVAVVAAVPVLLGVVPTAGRAPGPGTRGVPPAVRPSPPAGLGPYPNTGLPSPLPLCPRPPWQTPPPGPCRWPNTSPIPNHSDHSPS